MFGPSKSSFGVQQQNSCYSRKAGISESEENINTLLFAFQKKGGVTNLTGSVGWIFSPHTDNWDC